MRSINLHLYILIIIASLIISCRTDKKINDEVIYHDTIIVQGCYVFNNIDHFIVDNQADYKLLAQSPILIVTCPDGILIDIDFDEYILLGHQTLGVCSATYQRKIIWNEITNELSYTIDAQYIGECERLESNFNWVIVPRYSNEMDFIFNINEQ